MSLTDREKSFNHCPPSLDELSNPSLTSFWAIPPLSQSQLGQLSPAALAYLGDAIYELYIRCHYLLPPKRIRTYHHQVVEQVRAEQQAHHLKQLLPHLTPTEQEILKRGRNAATTRTRRMDPVIYQQATSFETLVGYLYLTDPTRLSQLFAQLNFDSQPEP